MGNFEQKEKKSRWGQMSVTGNRRALGVLSNGFFIWGLDICRETAFCGWDIESQGHSWTNTEALKHSNYMIKAFNVWKYER